jgi:hypothetical protein
VFAGGIIIFVGLVSLDKEGRDGVEDEAGVADDNAEGPGKISGTVALCDKVEADGSMSNIILPTDIGVPLADPALVRRCVMARARLGGDGGGNADGDRDANTDEPDAENGAE